jgi:hypothetical protein
MQAAVNGHPDQRQLQAIPPPLMVAHLQPKEVMHQIENVKEITVNGSIRGLIKGGEPPQRLLQHPDHSRPAQNASYQ